MMATASQQIERTLPVSEIAERTVLGSVLMDNAAWSSAKQLCGNDFGYDSNRRIFAGMSELAEDAKAIDIVTLIEHLGQKGELEAVGGRAYLFQLTDGLPYRRSIEQYVAIVREKAALREVIIAANIAISLAMDADRPASELIDLMRNKLSDLAANTCVGKDTQWFVEARDLIDATPRTVDWRVDRVIEQGTSGFVIGLPKAAKSYLVASLAVSLATGVPWFDLNVTPCRVALVSREDRPETTARRIRRILKGIGIPPPAELLINTRKQTEHLMLDNAGELNSLIRSLKKHKAEFLILDVLNVLHDADENDNAEMRSVLKRVEQIRSEVGCQVCIVHHARKQWDEGMTLSEIARGASAISGFAEFILGVRLVDEKYQVRQIKFETKAAEPHAAFTWKIQDEEDGVKLARVQWEPPSSKAKFSK